MGEQASGASDASDATKNPSTDGQNPSDAPSDAPDADEGESVRASEQASDENAAQDKGKPDASDASDASDAPLHDYSHLDHLGSRPPGGHRCHCGAAAAYFDGPDALCERHASSFVGGRNR